MTRMGACELLAPIIGPAGHAITEPALAGDLVHAVRNLAAFGGARPRLMASGAPAAVLVLMRKFLVKQPKAAAEKLPLQFLCVVGCGALRNLAVAPEHRAALTAAGACSAALMVLRHRYSDADAALAACSLRMALAFEPANGEPLLTADAASEAIKAMRRYPRDARIGWAVAGLLLKLANAVGSATGRDSASYLPLLVEGVGAALAMHGAADARVARAAVTAVSALKTASGGAELPAALLESVRSVLAAHEVLAGEVAARIAGQHEWIWKL